MKDLYDILNADPKDRETMALYVAGGYGENYWYTITLTPFIFSLKRSKVYFIVVMMISHKSFLIFMHEFFVFFMCCVYCE